MQRVTLLLSSTIVVEFGLDTKGREEVTRDMIENILRMIMVCFPDFFCLVFFFDFLVLYTLRNEDRTSHEKEWTH